MNPDVFNQQIHPFCRAAVLKIIGTLQSTMIKAKDGALPAEEIRKASNFLKEQLENVCKDNVSITIAENKSCMLGLQTYILLCKILDSNIMYDYEEKELKGVLQTPRRTERRISSLISKFRLVQKLCKHSFCFFFF